MHGRIPRLGAGRSRLPSRWREADESRRRRVRAGRAGAHRHAGRDRACATARRTSQHVFSGGGYAVGLLQLHVVGGARRRRLRGVRGDRRHLRSGDREEACTTTSIRPAARAIRPSSTRRSAAGCRRADALLQASAGFAGSRHDHGRDAWTSTPPDIAAASSRAPHHAAAEAGRAILAEGGNALEAMVAMAATIAAVYPHMNHIGGDGFWLVREPSGRVRALMARGPRRRQGDAASSIATATTRSRRAGRSRRSPCRARSPAGCWRSKPRKAHGGTLPLDVLLGAGDPPCRARATW